MNADLPPALASILNVGASTPMAPAAPTPMAAGLSAAFGGQQSFVPSYQVGGMIGPGGMPETRTPPNPQMLDMQVSRMATQNPQGVAELRAAVQTALASGELTPQELNMLLQLIKVAAQNPDMYSRMRAFAIQQGLADEDDLPMQYDEGLVLTLLLVARAVEADIGGQNMMQGGSPAMAGAQPIPSMARGGMTPDSKKSDGSVLINAHEGEYVIPAHIVKAKGTEFFDKLIGKNPKGQS